MRQSRRLAAQFQIHYGFFQVCKKLVETETTVRDAWEESLKEIWGIDSFKKK